MVRRIATVNATGFDESNARTLKLYSRLNPRVGRCDRSLFALTMQLRRRAIAKVT
jgi:hypothetical protein